MMVMMKSERDSQRKRKKAFANFKKVRTVKVNNFSISLSTPADLSSFSLNLK